MEGAVRPHFLDRLPVAALGLALPLPFASLPLFAFGYWDKAEPMVAWFHIGAAFAWLAVAIAGWRSGREAAAAAAHPYVLVPLALALWSMLAAPATELPWLSLFGPPQSGLGALWFLDFAGYGACALLAIRHPHAWKWLVRWAVLITLAVAVLKGYDWLSLRRQGGTLLLFVPSYYGWMALALAPLALTMQGRADRMALLVGAVLVAAASASLTIALLLIFGLAYVALSFRGRGVGWIGWTTASRTATAIWVVAAALLPWLLLQTLPWMRLKESLRDRWLVEKMVGSALAADPRLLFGHGWGRTQDAFHAWLNTTGERLWNSDWIFLSSDYFHSHNWGVESLYAAGLPGLLLTLAGFLALPWWAAPQRRAAAAAFAIAIAVFHGVWFQLSLSLPLMAMAFASLAGDAPSFPRSRPVRIIAPAAALAPLIAAAMLISFGLRMSATHPPEDFRGSDLAASELIRDTLARRPAPPAADIDLMLDFIDRHADRTPTIMLLTTGLTAMAQIHVTGELAFAAEPRQVLMWRRWLTRLLVLAPGRTDQAIPYLTLAISAGQWDEVAGFSRRVLDHDPNDPVGLHYGGLSLLARANGEEERTAGLSMLRRAVAAGIERFIPLDEDMKRSLGVAR